MVTMPGIPALRSLSQATYELEVSLNYIARLLKERVEGKGGRKEKTVISK